MSKDPQFIRSGAAITPQGTGMSSSGMREAANLEDARKKLKSVSVSSPAPSAGPVVDHFVALEEGRTEPLSDQEGSQSDALNEKMANDIIKRLTENRSFEKAFEAWKKDRVNFNFDSLMEAATREVLMEICDPEKGVKPTDDEIKSALANMFTEDVKKSFQDSFALMEDNEKRNKNISLLMKALAFGGLAVAACTAGAVIAVGGYGAIVIHAATAVFGSIYDYAYKGARVRRDMISNTNDVFSALYTLIDKVFGYEFAVSLLRTGAVAGVGAAVGWVGKKLVDKNKKQIMNDNINLQFVSNLRNALNGLPKSLNDRKADATLPVYIPSTITDRIKDTRPINEKIVLVVNDIKVLPEGQRNQAILGAYADIYSLSDDNEAKQQYAALLTKQLIREGDSIWPQTSATTWEKIYAGVEALKPAGLVVSMVGMFTTSLVGALPAVWDISYGDAKTIVAGLVLEPIKTPLAIMTLCLGGAKTLVNVLKAVNSVSQKKAVQQLASLAEDQPEALRMFVAASAVDVGKDLSMKQDDVLKDAKLPQSDKVFLEKKTIQKAIKKQAEESKKSWVERVKAKSSEITQWPRNIFGGV